MLDQSSLIKKYLFAIHVLITQDGLSLENPAFENQHLKNIMVVHVPSIMIE